MHLSAVVLYLSAIMAYTSAPVVAAPPSFSSNGIPLPLSQLTVPVEIAQLKQSFVLDTVNHVVDLTKTILRQATTVSVQYVGSDGTATAQQESTVFYLAQPLRADNRKLLALLEVRIKNKKGQILAVEKAMAHDHVQYYSVNVPASSSGKTVLFVHSVYVKTILPYPRKIKQLETQMYEVSGNVHFLSPYKSRKQRTTVKLPNSQDIPTYSQGPKPVTRGAESIVYGPYTNLPELSRSVLYVHYLDTNAVLVAKKYTKRVQVSHWGGNLAVQEDFEVHHQGAELKSHFSRVDFKLTANGHARTNVVKDFTAILPKEARNAYFKDTIGNVSTSHFRKDADSASLWIKPRYPLYGGWKYTWFHGYDVPTSAFLHKDTNTDSFVLQLPFKTSISHLTAETAKMVVVLPEGANNVKVETSFLADTVSESVVFSYLDSTGCPTVTINKANLIDEHEGLVQITYTYDTMRLLQKPLVVSAYAFGLFIVFIIYARLDFSIVKDPVKDVEERLEAYRIKVSKLVERDNFEFDHVNLCFEEFKSTHDIGVLDAVYHKADEVSTLAYKSLDRVAVQTRNMCKEYADRIQELVGLLKLRTQVSRGIQGEVKLFIKDAGNRADQVKKRAMNALINKGLAEVEVLTGKIAALVDEIGE
ncbi:hypothetical protein BASA61_003535 [Batrachochytrium salamandrivorans]|nr:hypothetical protein BASA61_003535 [Batrachochytrium salamandrivorans]KAH9246063.1 hypothetical protein BASA81_016400 [Batrachochytrium salamandrivorans]